MRIRVHFEPEDIVVDTLNDVQNVIDKIRPYITVRKTVLIDEYGFPLIPEG